MYRQRQQLVPVFRHPAEGETGAFGGVSESFGIVKEDGNMRFETGLPAAWRGLEQIGLPGTLLTKWAL